jgi:hypothetical protein
MVVFKDIVREEAGALGTGAVGSGVGPLAGDGLDEALGFAVGLRSISAGKLVLDAELGARGGKGMRTIADPAVGEHALDLDAVEGVEADGLLERSDDTGDLFVWQHASVGKTRAIIDGDVKRLDAGAFAAIGAIAGAADSGSHEATELLDVEMEQFAGVLALVALHGSRRRIESGQSIESVTAQDARDGSF